MKNLQELTTGESFILLTAISSGAITELSNESLFTFDKEEADSNPDLIRLGEAQTVTFETLILDETNPSKPCKSLKTGIHYTFEELEGITDRCFIFSDLESLSKSIELFKSVGKSFNNK